MYTEEERKKGFINNCHLVPKTPDDVMFYGRDDADGSAMGTAVANLDGYAIIPRDLYEKLAALPGAKKILQKDHGERNPATSIFAVSTASR